MTRQQLHTRLGREPAERLTPLSAGEADSRSKANRQAAAVSRPATGIAAHPHRAVDGA
jgi:hypothetical protein